MPWIKLDHILLTHPKVFRAPGGFGLYCMSLLHTDHHGTDGFIPEEAIPNLLRGLKGVPRLRQQLIQAGLWVEVEGGIQIHNYLKHNRSSEEAAELKAKRASAGAIGGSKPQANASGLLQQMEANREQDNGALLKHAQAEKSREEKSREEKGLKARPAKRRTQLPLDFRPDDTSQQLCRERDLDYPSELSKFVNHHKAKGTTMLDWQSAFRTWIDRAEQFRRSPPNGPDPPKGRNARNFDAVIQRLGVNDEPDAGTTDHQVSQRGLPEGRVEPGEIRALG